MIFGLSRFAQVVVRIAGPDPGYRATATMVVATALTILDPEGWHCATTHAASNSTGGTQSSSGGKRGDRWFPGSGVLTPGMLLRRQLVSDVFQLRLASRGISVSCEQYGATS
jgi:hypothetical protein